MSGLCVWPMSLSFASCHSCSTAFFGYLDGCGVEFNDPVLDSIDVARSSDRLQQHRPIGRDPGDGEMTAGEHQVIFDGSRLASGVYFYRMMAGNFVQTRKIAQVT